MTVPTFLRFADLAERGIVRSWTQLSKLQRDDGFPSGRLIGPRTRVWTTDEVAGWLAMRPTEKVITPEPLTARRKRAAQAAAPEPGEAA